MRSVGGVRSGDRWPLIAFPAAWVAVGLVARLSVPADQTFSPIWPAAGVALLWFLLREVTWRSPDVLLLAAAAVAVNVATGVPLDTGLLLGVTNVVQTLVVVALLRRWRPTAWGSGGDVFDSVRAASSGLAALVVGMVAGALLGALGQVALGHGSDLGATLMWLNRNLSGTLVVAPLGLLALRHLASPRPRSRAFGGRAGAIELGAVTTLTVALYAVGPGEESLPLTFLLPIPTVWIGVRFLPLATALHASVAGVALVGLTLAGVGRFAAIADPDTRIALAQTYVMTAVFIGLALATRRAENRALADGLRRAEREARFRAELLDTVIAAMTEGVAVVDDADRVLVRNPAADRFGYVATRRTGDEHPGFEVFHPDGTPVAPAQRPSQRALRGEVVEDEELVLAPDGLGQVLAVTAVPLRPDEVDGRPRALLMFRDTTEAFTRRAELATFAGTVAHDLRNPLTAIEGWTEMLEDEVSAGDLDPVLVTSFLHQLRLATSRMHSLIADLLDHATSGHRRLEVEKVDLEELVADIAAARGATATVRCEELPWVTADRVLVSQVLDNLIGNALKYVAPGVTPEVVVSGSTAGSGWARISVTDNGVGLPPGEQERVFQEFHRAHGADYEGTGLGLAIVRRIVLRHGGDVHARAREEGCGSVFEFTLPAYG